MKKGILQILSLCLSLAILVGCADKTEETKKKRKKVKKETEEITEKTKETDDESEPDIVASDVITITPAPTPVPGSITTFSMYINMYEHGIDDNNDIQNEIAALTGVKIEESSLADYSSYDVVSKMLANGNLTDLIDAGSDSLLLYNSNALIPWDDYLADPAYSNLRSMYSDKEWELFRQDDGHIYWANVFGTVNGEDNTIIHNNQAFWIQVRVLEWAGYPYIKTLDEYFDLLERYYESNKYNADGTKIIPYMCLCDDWRYFCLEHNPGLLDGYADDGPVFVRMDDNDDPKVELFDTTDTAYKYMSVLNEAYRKGLIDPDFDKYNYDDYMKMLETGAVLGLSDQWWDFAYTINDVFEAYGFDDLGYNYVPLGLTIDHDMENHWHSYSQLTDYSSGVAVTINCANTDLVFQFMNRCLDQDIMNLRFWGIEGEDYLVDDQGMFYRTDEMRSNWNDSAYCASHACLYEYLPQYYIGYCQDGINAVKPSLQTCEFFATLADPLVKCFNAYGYTTYVDFLHSEKTEPGPWYPLYFYTNEMMANTPGGKAKASIEELKHKYLPLLVKSDDFDADWNVYISKYKECDPDDFVKEVQDYLNSLI